MRITRYTRLVKPIEYGQSIKDMVGKVIGDHEWVNRDITEKHFPMNGRVLRDYIRFCLAFFDKEVLSNAEILAEFKHEGLQPGRLEDLLIFGCLHPDEQTEQPINAIGAVWDKKVPYLGISGITPNISEGRRGLSLRTYDRGWKKRDAFLAVELIAA